MRARAAGRRSSGRSIGLVPTMGALHAGHGALLERGRAGSDYLVASIFVNPLQFDRRDDFEAYGRNLAADVEFCSAHGVDAVFAPAVEELYPAPQQTFVEVGGVSARLEGQFRPGHFRGVATVVSKLFHIVSPDRAWFGEKDAQQLAVIGRMVKDLNLAVEIVPVATVRERDGLALSSRNRRLSADERAAAPLLHRALCAVRQAIEAGSTDPTEAVAPALGMLRGEPRFRVEYLEVVDPAAMAPVGRITGRVLIAAAAWLGETRLIDNVGAG
jgi:pantoate--beta-alanine ligase